jgi:transposase
VECLIPTVKSGQQGVMVWGCFAKHNLGPLVKLEGRVTAAVYKKVLKNNLIPFLEGLDNQDNYFFQEDNAPIHKANIIKRWKVKHKVNSIPWPAQSPDLNPIENLWDELERQVRAHTSLPKNREDLWEILQEEWSNLDVNKYQNLVDSMPCRVAAVIKSKGHPTKY